jgi:peptidyl-prolyl cis-trans isomerase A (cyclophilin A)
MFAGRPYPAAGLLLAAVAGCAGPPFPPSAGESGSDGPRPATSAPAPAAAAEPADPTPIADPTGGSFSLADATAGLSGSGPLVAVLTTSMGQIRCELFEDRAPNTVANFVGLARGLRPFKSVDGKWVKKPGYDGTTFHRVIKGFMIQGGDPRGTGMGEPGYVIPDELWPGSKHDRAGQLCMANRGPNTNGMQFFITDAAVPQLDGNYTIFGECAPTSVIHAIATVPKGPRDMPETPVTIVKVEVTRAPAEARPATAKASDGGT